jgi:hypothetical protein
VEERVGQINFDVLEEDDDFSVDRLSKDLAKQLRQVCDVSFPADEPTEGDKGAGELMVATLNVLTGVDPVQIEAILRILGSFTRRNPKRKIRLRIGEDEIEIDNPTSDHLDALVQSFVDRRKN